MDIEARIEGLHVAGSASRGLAWVAAMRIMEGIKLAMKRPGLSGLILLGLIAVFRFAGALLLRFLESLR